MTLGELRLLVLEAIMEAGGGNASYPYIRDAVGPSMADREAIGHLADGGMDDEEDELPPHLREPQEDPEDCFGPVPPTDEDNPYAISDPYASDYHVIPTPQGKIRSG